MNLKEILIPIKKDVDVIESFIRSQLQSNIPLVESVVEYVVQNGGKRLRPILTVLSARVAGASGEEAVAIGSAIEFLHTASLLHDDVIDHAPLRRGRPSTNNKWGNHVCVLVGDFFYCRAMDILVKHGDIRILRVVTDAVTLTTEGEIAEITQMVDIQTTEEDYTKIIRAKTAELMAASCQAGALLAKVSGDYEKALYEFGLNLGIAFQLMDDVLDYTANENEFGKINGGDLKEGKLTLPLIQALKKCDVEERRQIQNALIADQITPEHFQTVLSIIKKYDGVSYALDKARKHILKANAALDPFKPSLSKEMLAAIGDYVIDRSI